MTLLKSGARLKKIVKDLSRCAAAWMAWNFLPLASSHLIARLLYNRNFTLDDREEIDNRRNPALTDYAS